MTLAEALRLLEQLTHAFPGREIRAETLRTYAEEMLDLTPTQGAAAIYKLMVTGKHAFPSIADVRLAVAEDHLDTPPSMEAYSYASHYKQMKGDGKPLHPLVIEAMKQVGDAHTWATSPAESLRPAFMAAYRDLREQAIRELVMGDLNHRRRMTSFILERAGIEEPAELLAPPREED